MIRQLLTCQTHDPARGSFMVKIETVSGKRFHGKPVYVAPKGEPGAIEFTVID